MPGIIGGHDPHYRGNKQDGQGMGTATAWNCPACGTKNVTPPEDGCPSCGSGTVQQAEQARAAQGQVVTDAQLQQALCGAADLHTAVALPSLERRARLTLARALAHYAEQGGPAQNELPRVYILDWARKIDAALAAEEDETK